MLLVRGVYGQHSLPRQQLLRQQSMRQQCGSGGQLSLPRQPLQQQLVMLPGTGLQGQRSQKQQLQLGVKVMQQRSAGGVVHSSGLSRTPARQLMICL
jgi:hypothetical protein